MGDCWAALRWEHMSGNARSLSNSSLPVTHHGPVHGGARRPPAGALPLPASFASVAVGHSAASRLICAHFPISRLFLSFLHPSVCVLVCLPACCCSVSCSADRSVGGGGRQTATGAGRPVCSRGVASVCSSQAATAQERSEAKGKQRGNEHRQRAVSEGERRQRDE